MFEFLSEQTAIPPFLGRFVAIVLLFVVAWVVTRIGDRVAVRLIARNEARQSGELGPVDTGVIANLRRRDTTISLVQASVRYVVYGLAFVLSFIALTGADQVEALIGASFIALVLAFSAREVIADVLSGLLMHFDGWVRLGDTIIIEPWGMQGVVEAASVRSITIRGVNGEKMYVRNAEIKGVRVVPRGRREVEIELFVSDVDEARGLISELARIVPRGPTQFVRAPAVYEVESLDDDLARVIARASVAPGREWLVEDLLPSLLKERAPDGVVVHGPVITAINERATRRFGHATALRRQDGDDEPAKSYA